MCGIAGYIDLNKNSSKEELISMTDSLTYRGPDDAGYALWNNEAAAIGFGHRRLSIIDLSPLGHQPMSSKDDLHIIFNGEIYNYQEIRAELLQKGYQFNSHSDTEVILNAYRQWGMKMLSRFIGMFSMAIYDNTANKVILVRDRAGVKPLYYYWENNVFLFASELKAFHKHPKFIKKINSSCLRSYLQYGYVPAPDCIFLNTHKLLPGHYLEFDLSKKTFDTIKYWDVAHYYQQPQKNISEQEAIEETDRLVLKACQYRMVADVPVGVFLSGGYDSSLVAAVLQKNSTQKIKTFTIGFEEQQYNEAVYAKKVADHIGTDHQEHYCTSKDAKAIIPTLPFFYDEPFGDSSAIPTILVSKFAREQVTVALSADAGDEIFAGYNKYKGVLDIVNKIENVPAALRKSVAFAINSMPAGILKSITGINDNSRENIKKVVRYFKEDVSAVQIMDEASYSSPVERINKFLAHEYKEQPDYFGIKNWSDTTDKLKSMLAVDYISYMANDILTKVDRATMSVSLEGREPLLDQSIVEWAATLPSYYKLNNGTSKYILKKVAHKYIPAHIMERPKMGFGVPVINWFRGDLKNLFDYYFSEEALGWHGYFNAKQINQAVKRYHEGADETFVLLWYVLMFQMWYEKWMR
jgi:asparagine synthase (glutamine-hydrolysing)